MNTLASAEVQIRKSVEDLRFEKQRERELHLERVYQALIVALHTNCHWSRAKWR